MTEQPKRRIRAATTEDARELQSCAESAYSTYLERLNGARLPPMDVDYAAEISNYPTWIFESDERVVGGLIMVFASNHAAIANIVVSPVFQGQGIGGKLLRFAESEARANGYTELKLATHVLLNENIALYQYLGWIETARDNTRVFMCKTL